MTFTVQLKQEILRNRPMRARHKLSHAYGLLLFAQSFGEDLRLSTEQRAIAKLYSDSISTLVGLTGSITVLSRTQAGKEVFDVKLDSAQDAAAALAYFGQNKDDINLDNLPSEEDRGAFLAGGFLACGSIIDPAKSYHLEFAVPRPGLAQPLAQLLVQMGFSPKTTLRRGMPVVYFRDSEEIEGLIALMGAARLTLEIMNIKIYKDLRNKANRQSNCDTANIDKSVTAGATQVADIELIVRHGGWTRFDEDLRELARLRLEQPEASLRELGELMSLSLSRSGINHRLRRIAALAQEIRESGGK